MSDVTDAEVIVVGAGPAGISCALWLEKFGLSFDWVDKRGRVGGMLRRVHNEIADYAGRIYDDGPQLADDFAAQLSSLDLTPEGVEVTDIAIRDAGLFVHLDGTDPQTYRLAVVATGTSYRQLDIPGEAEGMGDYVSQSATQDGARFSGRDVAVVGGGDAAFENALILANLGCRVTLLLRRKARARPLFVDAVEDDQAISVAPIPSVVESIEPTPRGCRLHVRQCGESVERDVTALFVRIGVDPLVPDGLSSLETDDEGYLVIDERGRTSDDRILAAGDVTASPLPSVATAVGQGAQAARTAGKRLGEL